MKVELEIVPLKRVLSKIELVLELELGLPKIEILKVELLEVELVKILVSVSTVGPTVSNWKQLRNKLTNLVF